MSDTSPIIVWLRRDFRLLDNRTIYSAYKTGRPIIPVFIMDPETESIGTTPLWRLGEAVSCFDKKIRGIGSRIILRKGVALECLESLIAETGASSVYWTRYYEPSQVKRDTEIKQKLGEKGIEVESYDGHLLLEPWETLKDDGGYYRVYTPFYKALAQKYIPEGLPAPDRLLAPNSWPASDDITDWNLGNGLHRAKDILQSYADIGEDIALDKLDDFIDGPIKTYRDDRDRLDCAGTSRLSENLTYGEISPRVLWHRGYQAKINGAQGAEHFLKEVVWRDFAWNLTWHTPHILTDSWRPEWKGMPWADHNETAERWCRAQTGEPIIDAAMRELYVTGIMHNRMRMVVASYLTKNLLIHWKVGMNWFADCLLDWDPASNAMGWQWVAGCGPDAAPYFRIFNARTQAEKFDPQGRYRDKYAANGEVGSQFYDMVPLKWKLDQSESMPLVDLKESRQRALDVYKHFKS